MQRDAVRRRGSDDADDADDDVVDGLSTTMPICVPTVRALALVNADLTADELPLHGRPLYRGQGLDLSSADFMPDFAPAFDLASRSDRI
jgi:hypothetical protein